MDYFLRTDSAFAMSEAMAAAGLEMVDGLQGNVNVSVVGLISQEIGLLDADGNPIVQPIPGFHVNLRGELSEEQHAKLPAIPRPANPVRVWA